MSRARHAGGDLAAAFARRRQDQIGSGHRRHLDVKVDAVERAGQAALVFRDATGIRPALAGKTGIVGASAAARVHAGDQHEPRRISDAVVDARNGDVAGFQRLAQRIQNLRGEFRHFVEEQHAVMGERNFARPRAQAAADQRRHGGGMVR